MFDVFDDFKALLFCIKHPGRVLRLHSHSWIHLDMKYGFCWVQLICLCRYASFVWDEYHHHNGKTHIHVLKSRFFWKINLVFRILCGLLRVHCCNKGPKLKSSRSWILLSPSDHTLVYKVLRYYSSAEPHPYVWQRLFGGFLQ